MLYLYIYSKRIVRSPEETYTSKHRFVCAGIATYLTLLPRIIIIIKYTFFSLSLLFMDGIDLQAAFSLLEMLNILLIAGLLAKVD